MATVTLEVPDELVDLGESFAAELRKLPPEGIRAWFEGLTRRAAEDPLEKHIGAYRSKSPGWSRRHHQILGEALLPGRRSGGEEP